MMMLPNVRRTVVLAQQLAIRTRNREQRRVLVQNRRDIYASQIVNFWGLPNPHPYANQKEIYHAQLHLQYRPVFSVKPHLDRCIVSPLRDHAETLNLTEFGIFGAAVTIPFTDRECFGVRQRTCDLLFYVQFYVDGCISLPRRENANLTKFCVCEGFIPTSPPMMVNMAGDSECVDYSKLFCAKFHLDRWTVSAMIGQRLIFDCIFKLNIL